MAKITIAQLQTSDSYINELTDTELDVTKGGLLVVNNLLNKNEIVKNVLNHNDIDILNKNDILSENHTSVDVL